MSCVWPPPTSSGVKASSGSSFATAAAGTSQSALALVGAPHLDGQRHGAVLDRVADGGAHRRAPSTLQMPEPRAAMNRNTKQ